MPPKKGTKKRSTKKRSPNKGRKKRGSKKTSRKSTTADRNRKGSKKPGQGATLTVAELKEQLRARGLPVSGVRSALIDRLRRHEAKVPTTAKGKKSDIKNKVRTLITQQYGRHDSETQRQIEAKIEEVLADPSFRGNPGKFMEKWREERGTKEVLIIPDDPARYIIEYLLVTRRRKLT